MSKDMIIQMLHYIQHTRKALYKISPCDGHSAIENFKQLSDLENRLLEDLFKTENE